MPKSLILAAIVGLALVIALIAYYGAASVLDAVAAVGWGAALVTLVRVAETSGAGLAWWLALPGVGGGLIRICMLLRWLREAINVLLPVAHVGGDLIGARLLTFWGVPGGTAGASIVVDLFAQTVTQFFFTLIGLACLVQAGGDTAIVRGVVIGLAILGPALIGFFVAQRFGGFHLLEKALLHLAKDPKWAALGGVASLNDRLQDIYRRPLGLSLCFAMHLAIWFFGVLEVWVALHFMGYPVDYRTALVIESLGQAVRGAAFVVPGAIGVQESGFIALCAVFGIPAPTAIALSLVKRLPEVALGLPGLVIWQGIEGRNLLRSPGQDPKQRPRSQW
jgi:putative membrane protein